MSRLLRLTRSPTVGNDGPSAREGAGVAPSSAHGRRTKAPLHWPHHGEVAAIERGDLGAPEPLGCGHHRGVDRPERQVAVGRHQLGDAKPVRGRNRVRNEVAGGEVAEEADVGVDAEACTKQVGHLSDDQLRDDQGSRVGLQQLEALGVVRVVTVDVGVERPCVDDQGDEPTSPERICSMRSETCAWPLAPAPAARSRRRARVPPRCASIASRVSCETVVPRRWASVVV